MNELTTKPMQYLDKAMGALRDLGLMPDTPTEAPITALLEQISDLDPDRVVVIARTMTQTSVFNEVVRGQISGMSIGTRYEEITNAFNSIRDDAKTMVDQLSDGKLSGWEKLTNAWMNLRRGDIPDRFDSIRETYLEVARDTKDQIEREQVILRSYQDFRGALKQAQVLSLEVFEKAEKALDEAKGRLGEANKTIEAYTGDEASERARLEMARDERMREMQDEEKRYQVAKDLSDNLTIGYNTSEVIMARLMQTTNAKERVYSQAVSFFSTNEAVLTALKASFTSLAGLHESTQTLEAMKEGVSKSLETLSEIGDQVQEAALKAGYGPTIRATALKKLVDSVVNFQVKSREIIQDMRVQATENSKEIERAVEDGKRRLAQLAAQGNQIGRMAGT